MKAANISWLLEVGVDLSKGMANSESDLSRELVALCELVFCMW